MLLTRRATNCPVFGDTLSYLSIDKEGHNHCSSLPLDICRDKALGLKDEVDGVLSGFVPVEGSLSNLDNRLQNNANVRDKLNDNLKKV